MEVRLPERTGQLISAELSVFQSSADPLGLFDHIHTERKYKGTFVPAPSLHDHLRLFLCTRKASNIVDKSV